MPSIGEYLSFSCIFLLAFGAVFEMPVFIICLARLGIITHKQLQKYRKIVIIGIFIAAAILTPTPPPCHVQPVTLQEKGKAPAGLSRPQSGMTCVPAFGSLART